MNKLAAIAAVTAVLCFGATYVMAEQEPSDRGTKDEQDACISDVFRLCSSQIPDEDRIVICLKTNMRKLSPACRKVVAGG